MGRWRYDRESQGGRLSPCRAPGRGVPQPKRPAQSRRGFSSSALCGTLHGLEGSPEVIQNPRPRVRF